ncbi:molybdate ABC transporter substrate-binding protein [Novosphingobium sp.]|uniref:molybdate ABC transporter substrate-binding protein n=1 Tax=Novosphingobium sp. TaxID=1874826 RepID=UPI00261993BB|nr:molybdate ABC transporter substrate-binding protein [Novosphingobium sp.]
MRWLGVLVMGLGLALGLVNAALAAPAPRPPIVLAAASLQESLTAVADAWARQGHPRPTLSFAASSALARQIDAGAPADLFVSADEEWMDYLAQHNRLRPGTRVSLLTNRLVLIAPAASRIRLAVAPGFPLARALGPGRLAMADPDSVPAGKYGREALTALGVWSGVERQVVRGENVRAALALVARGEAPLGIVFATDALASPAVRVVGLFPATSHAPIRYPVARLARSDNPEGEAFRRFLLSPPARTIFRRFGFGLR